MTIKQVFLWVGLLLSISLFAQDSQKCFQEINTQVWNTFSNAFEKLDLEAFKSIHSQNLIRVSGDNKSIRNAEEYFKAYKTKWQSRAIKQSIQFRFIERVCNTNRASERGIYKLTRNPNTSEEKSYYGQFHVILVKKNQIWKILVDYDSSENNSANEDSFLEGHGLKEFSKF
ncbi:DUF4440 domain-containing protein [Mangrovimonas aestuarii]|uniref:DUF4440 domain-containing protein n=1 Tax=Mangrovimonas aestuarii TaxID=3018443 RepID=UPI002378A673|nr:DUF4440 domain-containing protein [Mangrovimonas aestuarii]